MYRKLLVFSLLPCICLADVDADDSKLLGEFIKESADGVPLLENLAISGQLNFSFVAVNQSLSDKKDNPTFSLDGDVNIDYKTIVDGIGWGFKVGTKARSGMIKGGSAIVDTSYLFVDTDKFGQVRFGYSKSAGSMFSISYADVMTGYNFMDSGNAPTFFAHTSGTILGTGFDKDDAKALKVCWISPTVKGWTVGLSYAPNSRDGHLFKEKRNKVEKDYSPAQNFADQTAFIKDSYTGGISYEYGDPEAFNFKVAVAGWTAQARSTYSNLRNIQGYNVGAIFGYGKYKLGLGYTDNINSMIPEELSNEIKDTSNNIVGMGPGANNGKIYNVGIGYFGDKWELSAGYFQGEKKWSYDDKAISKVTTVAVQYNVDKMLSAYVEYNNIRAKTTDRIYNSELDVKHGGDGVAYKNNRANLFIVGAKVNI